jgi:hypothetical protein
MAKKLTIGRLTELHQRASELAEMYINGNLEHVLDKALPELSREAALATVAIMMEHLDPRQRSLLRGNLITRAIAT